MDSLQVEVLPFTENRASVAAQLYAVSAPLGLSLGDRACLATAIDLDEQVVTADRIWADLSVSIEVVVVR
jgi:PIN domain nuclease of toxin-antitoxin system